MSDVNEFPTESEESPPADGTEVPAPDFDFGIKPKSEEIYKVHFTAEQMNESEINDDDSVEILLSDEQVDDIFKRRFRETCRSIPVNCLRWIDPLCAIACKDTDGVIPNVIDMQSAGKMELARCADLCKRLEALFQELFETVKSNRAHACKYIGIRLEEDEEGDFILTNAQGAERARFKRSEEFLVNVQDEPKMLGWLFLNGFGDIVKTYYIHPMSLMGVIKQWVANGGAMPDQTIVKCHKDPLAKVTKVYDVDGVWDGEIAIQKQQEITDFTTSEEGGL